MNALVMGGAVAVVLAGPPLYGMVASGELDGTTAIGRGLLVAGACAGGAAYLLSLVREYEEEIAHKEEQEALLVAAEEAEAEAKRAADASETAAEAKAEALRRKSY
jgi:delta 1-pyrroline-5-carboxylate dehydrogenase